MAKQQRVVLLTLATLHVGANICCDRLTGCGHAMEESEIESAERKGGLTFGKRDRWRRSCLQGP